MAHTLLLFEALHFIDGVHQIVLDTELEMAGERSPH